MEKIDGQDVIHKTLERGRAQAKEKETALTILKALCECKASVGEAISALHCAEDMILQERISLQRNP